MSRTKDISRQNGVYLLCKVFVDEIGEWDKRKQIIKGKLEQGEEIEMTYWCDDEQLIEDKYDIGEGWYKIRLKDGYYQCKPETPPKDEPVAEKNDDFWYNINLGKCRHGILCAYIQSGKDSFDDEDLDKINQLAEFSMKGKIECKHQKENRGS